MLISKLLIIFSLLGSVSVRTPYIQPNPYDYEYIIGLDSQNVHFKTLFERENGKHYKGQDISLQRNICKEKVNITLKHFAKQAHEIDRQSVNVGYNIHKYFSIGVGFQSNYWKDTKGVYFNKVVYKGISAQITVNNEYVDTDVEYLQPLYKSVRLTLQTKLVYKNYSGKELMQLKTEWKYKFKNRWYIKLLK